MAMPSRELVELNRLLTVDTLGSVAAEVARVLAYAGPLTARDVSQRTGLAFSAVLRTLTSLVQTRLVLFWRDGTKTRYSANHAQQYRALWTGPLLSSFARLFRSEHPQAIAALLETFIVNGYRRAGDIVAEDSGATRALTELVQHHLLVPVEPQDFWPAADIEQRAVAEAAKTVDAVAESTRKAQALQQGRQELAKEAARRRASAAKLVISDGAQAHIEPDVVLAINWDRFLLAERRAELVALASRRIGTVTARVYEQVLIASEKSLFALDQPRIPGADTNVTTAELARALGDLSCLEIFDTVSLTELKEESAPKRLKTANGTVHLNASAKHELINKHLRLLEESTAHFLVRSGDKNGGEWFVPFDRAMDALRKITFDEIVSEAFGPNAARLVRVLRSFGKVDEKTLSQKALLQAKDMRHDLNNLQHYGFIDLQEVPRGNDRAPGRNLYFWYHRPKQAYAQLVEQLYKSSISIMHDIHQLRELHQTLLMKLDRKDVQAEPDEFLTAGEKDELAKYSAAEKALLASQFVVDRNVRIFRDY